MAEAEAGSKPVERVPGGRADAEEVPDELDGVGGGPRRWMSSSYASKDEKRGSQMVLQKRLLALPTW